MKDSWSPTLQHSKALPGAPRLSTPADWAEQESSPFLHPASSDQNHHLCATAHCCSSRETEGVIKDREISHFFQATTRLLGLLLRDSAETKVNRTSQRNGKHRLLSINCFNALAACTCSFSSFLQELCTEQDTGTRICPFCASPFPEGTRAVLASTGC